MGRSDWGYCPLADETVVLFSSDKKKQAGLTHYADFVKREGFALAHMPHTFVLLVGTFHRVTLILYQANNIFYPLTITQHLNLIIPQTC